MSAPTLAELDALASATARTTGRRDQDERAFALEWRPSTARRCPRVVAGLRCRAAAGSCPCRTHRRLLDHARMWIDADGRRVLTAEPYGAAGDDLAAFLADCPPFPARRGTPR